MIYPGVAGALLGIAGLILTVYADRVPDGGRLVLGLVGLVLFVFSVWQL